MAVAKAKKKASGKMKIGEVTFTQKSCGLSKSSAQQTAEKIRKTNRMARVISNTEGAGFCVYVGPVSKTLAKRNSSARKVAGTKRKAKK